MTQQTVSAPAHHSASNFEVPMPQAYQQPLALPPRIVWPWPVFVLGAIALATVWLGRPYWRPADGDRIRNDLAEMRQLLARTTPDLTRAAVLGTKILDQGTSHPQYVGEAHYLMGCVCMKRAEEAPDAESDWKDARKHLELAESSGVSEADQPRLAVRLAKALHKTKGDPKRILELLQKGDDPEAPAERWQIAAEVHLQQPEPNLAEAIAATKAQIPLLGPNDTKARAQAYYRLADLHLRKSEVPQALQALQEIRVTDSPEVFDASRVLMARCEQANHRYIQAAQAWEQLRGKAKTPVDKGVIAFELGYCYWKCGRLDEARKALSEAIAHGGEVAQAAGLRMAEIQLADIAGRTTCVTYFDEALRNVRKPADYRNTLYPVNQARQNVEKACLDFRMAGDFATAGKLAEMLGRLSGISRGKELGAEIAEAWGLALKADARTRSGQAAQHALDEANKQFRLAAVQAAEAAAPERPPTEQAEWLHRAARYYLMCSDKSDIQNAVGLLDRMVQLAGNSQADGEIMYLKAVAHEHLGEYDRAIEGYQACIKAGHPRQTRARHQLARLQMADLPAQRDERMRKLDEIGEELAKNLDPAVRELDVEATEQSSYLLAHVLYERRDWVKAEIHLTQALREFPNSDQAVNSRFLLGRTYWYQAGKESPTVHDPQVEDVQRAAARKRMFDMLKKGADVFEPLEDELLKREREQKLTDGDRVILRQTSFAAAECYFFMEEFEEAVRRYNLLRIRFSGQVEELLALSQIWQCYSLYLTKPEPARVALAAMRDLLKTMPTSAFNGSSPVHKQEFWENWIAQVDRPAPPKMP